MSAYTMLFDQDYVTEMREHEVREEGREEGIGIGREEGIGIGREEGKKAMLDRLVAAGLISKEEAEKQMALV